MTPQLLKLNIHFISLIYSNLINTCITHNNFPLSLKYSIHKKISLDYSIPNNYIPISNLYLLSKIFERIIATHIIKHITTNSLIIQCRVPTKLTITLKHYYLILPITFLIT